MVAGVVTLGAALGRWWWVTHPLTRCWWCRGTGKNPLSTKWVSGKCKHCGGDGKRKRKA